MESKKRKREDDTDPAANTIITFHAPNGRTFSRVFADKSLSGTRETVRRKLALGQDAKFGLAQLRNDKLVDLDDDDDFLAFRTLARTNSSLDVVVTVAEQPRDQTAWDTPQAGIAHLSNKGISQAQADPSAQSRAQQSTARDQGLAGTNGPGVSGPSKPPKATAVSSAKAAGLSSSADVHASYSHSDTAPARKKHKTMISQDTSQALLPVIDPVGQPTTGTETVPALPGSSAKQKRKKKDHPVAEDTPEHVIAFAAPEKPKKKRKAEEQVADGTAEADRSTQSLRPTTKKKKQKAARFDANGDSSSPSLPTPSLSSVPAQLPLAVAVKKPKEKKGKNNLSEKAESLPLVNPSHSTPPETSTLDNKKSKNKKALTQTSADPSREPSQAAEVFRTDDGACKPKQRKSKKKPADEGFVAVDPSPDVFSHQPPDSTPGISSKPPQASNVTTDKGVGTVAEKPDTTQSGSGAPAESAPKTKAKGKGKPATSSGIEETTPSGHNYTAQKANGKSGKVSADGSRKSQSKGPQAQPTPEQYEINVRSAVQAVIGKHAALRTLATSAQPVPQQVETAADAAKTSEPSILRAPQAQSTVANTEVARETDSPAAQPLPASPLPSKPAPATSRKAASCTICLKTPFHLRSKCPVITAGPASIRNRLDEVKKDARSKPLIRELELLLEKAERQAAESTSAKLPAVPTTPPIEPVSAPRTKSPEVPFPANIPAGLKISEVPVQGESDESDSDDSDSDSDSDSESDHADESPPTASFKSGLPPSQLSDGLDLEALLRGPVPSRSVLEEIPSKSSSERDEESEPSELASEEEEKNERAYKRLSKRFELNALSSDEEPDSERLPLQGSTSESGSVPPESVMDVDADADVPTGRITLMDSSSAEEVSAALQIHSTKEPASPAESTDSHPKPAMVSFEQGQKNTMDVTPSPDEDALPVEEIIPSSDPEDDLHEKGEAESSSSSPLGDTKNVTRQVPRTAQPFTQSSRTAPAPALNSATHQADDEGEKTSPARASSPEVPIFDVQVAHDFDGTDPIEPSEDAVDDRDSIASFEEELPDPQSATPPPQAISRPGTAKKMKDRHGNVRGPEELPVPASQALHSRASRQNAETVRDISVDEDHSPQPTEQTTRATSTPALGAPAPIPATEPLPATQPPPKKRGRPALSAEEKARRQAEKDQKTAEKKAEKEEKARQKAAEKEKAGKAKRNAGKSLSTASSKPISSSATKSVPPSVNAAGAPPTTPAPINQRTVSPVSSVKWTTLPETGDAEMSTVDELRSSSPSLHAAGPGEDDDSGTARPKPTQTQSSSQSQDKPVFPARDGPMSISNLVTPVFKGRMTNGATSATPLFLPTDSQPGTTQPLTRFLPNGGPSPLHPETESQSQEDSVVKKVVRPVSTWAQKSRFPRLSDIASQAVFSPLSTHPVPPRPPPEASKNAYKMFGDHESDDSSDDDSDSGAEVISHIPKDRRAGVKKK